ncbi:preprotein translocase subunit SecE [Candidatus Saccharibacteria bacterium]|nr:preprotein translocase subunit SecE [Candidatus Saccharibacteria bacterium]
MAKSTKKKRTTTSTKATSDTTVTRITASGSKKASKKPHTLTAQEKADIAENAELTTTKKKPSKAEVKEQLREKVSGRKLRPLKAMGEYFRGAWYELRQVRWPNRSSTWKMTGALLAFTVFIATVILLLDALFKYLFELMIGQ